jgi:uncharacterized protein (UPF0179 family)
MAKCTGRRCPMQVGYKVDKCNYKDCHYRDVEETKIEENSEVKIAEIVEDIDDTRENPEEIVRLMFDLFHEYGRPWYR